MKNECKFQDRESKEILKTITNSELKAKVKVNLGKLIDVRTTYEYNKNHIENAISIPIDELEGNLDRFDKRADLDIISNTESDTRKAVEILEKNGFTNVAMALPGMEEWQEKMTNFSHLFYC